jgi:Protein of unknown function (DUF2793)
MPTDTSPRHALPYLHVGQAQKEITHNEALARIDALLYPIVEATLSAPPTDLTLANDGQCWLVSETATGSWLDKNGQIAVWSGGSWRYIRPVEGMAVWNIALEKRIVYAQSAWVEPSIIANPLGGTMVDAEARSAITSILAHLRAVSSIAS